MHAPAVAFPSSRVVLRQRKNVCITQKNWFSSYKFKKTDNLIILPDIITNEMLAGIKIWSPTSIIVITASLHVTIPSSYLKLS